MTDIVRDPYGNPLNRDNLITALRAEVERLKEWNREIALNAREFVAENKKLRAALWDIHAVCNNWDWFIWMWPIRRIKRLARAALEEKQ